MQDPHSPPKQAVDAIKCPGFFPTIFSISLFKVSTLVKDET